MNDRPGLALSAFLTRICLFFGLAAPAVSVEPCPKTDRVSLAGTWTVRLDPRSVGLRQRWFATALAGQPMTLPGTTDLAEKGYRLDRQTMTYAVPLPQSEFPGRRAVTRLDEAGHLLRTWAYIGNAWYQRTLEVPPQWSDRHVRLCLERVIWQTQVWVDDRLVGSCDSLATEHQFDLGTLAPGRHRLTIRVDNRLVHNIGLASHAYGPETQSRWNGIVGRIQLLVTDPVFLRGVQVHPAPDRRSARVAMVVHNTGHQTAAGNLTLVLRPESGGDVIGSDQSTVRAASGRQRIERTVTLDRAAEPWDEFHPVRYVLEATLDADAGRHRCRTVFGFRHIQRRGRHILVNGRRIFLRGTLDCCVYPRTGHPPMTVERWLHVLGTIKQYGFNHVRFHTWCPPDAAFEAADRLGIYLAPETAFWVDGWMTGLSTRPKLLGRDPAVLHFVRREIRRISDAYGNHPSLAMFCIGNEFGMQTDWELVDRLVAEIKQYDSRRIYNATTARKRVASDDYWVTHRTGKAATRGVGPARTDWDFAAAAQSVDLPIIAHETGQRPVFPDYDALLGKFTGPLQPLNLVRLKRHLAQAGLADQTESFHRASARFQYLQYKAEHEAFLRTADYAGYQLLMLNDFTGQSEALVGFLDPFWQPKGVIAAESIRQWNAPTVVLARFARYTWSTNQTAEATIDVAHYGPSDLSQAVAHWSLTGPARQIVAAGQLPPRDVPTGGLTRLGTIAQALDSIDRPTALTLKVTLRDATNHWTLWAYPPTDDPPPAPGVFITRRLDRQTRQALNDGRRVLVLAHGVKNDWAAQGRDGFLSVYWSAGWWGNAFSSLGILCDPTHPALSGFPNDGHSDWQWSELTGTATTFLLDRAPGGFRPIVQPVTDFHHNHLLGHVFEARVGQGRLMVCGYDLSTKLEERPAARQFRRSLLQYVGSQAFDPQIELSAAYAAQLLQPR